MRRILIDPPTTKEWRRWVEDCVRATHSLCEAVLHGRPWVIKNIYKRAKIKKAYFVNKNTPPFFGKCAYCEGPITGYHPSDIDHFRPKAGVTDEHDRPMPHPGYYWLAYDWRNLLPACRTCNGTSKPKQRKIGKHNRFPVEAGSRHAQKPEEVADERPMLIHPASERPEDDPDLHLYIDTETGHMAHHTERGRLCIEIFGLNERDQLIEDRQRAMREVQALAARIRSQSRSAEAIQTLEAIAEGKHTFTMAQRAMLKKELPSLRAILDGT